MAEKTSSVPAVKTEGTPPPAGDIEVDTGKATSSEFPSSQTKTENTTCISGSSQESDYLSEDEQLENLQRSGDIHQVVGSQSMLSQELDAYKDNHTGLSQASVNTTDAGTDMNSQAMARKFGLLSQEPHAPPAEEEDVNDDAKAPTNEESTESQDTLLAKREETDSAGPKNDTNSQSSSSRSGLQHSSQFGTLLDAVEIFASQEQEQEEMKLNILSQEAIKDDPIFANHEGDEESEALVLEMLSAHQRNGRSYAPVKTRDGETKKPFFGSNTQRQLGSTAIHNSTGNSAQQVAATKRRKRKSDSAEKTKQQILAQRAAALAQRTINDPDLAKRLLLSMALTRENPRSPPSVLPGRGAIVPEGFFWAHYPPLEKVLKDNMAEYYELSITKCQSAQQQNFNNKLVDLVRAENDKQQWIFDKCFTDKCLRDRIRCYYKTHIQNAKKRLRTMVKNPTKRANARHLCAHLDLIEKYGTTSEGRDQKADDGSDENSADIAPNPKPSSHAPAAAAAGSKQAPASSKQAPAVAKKLAATIASNQMPLGPTVPCYGHPHPAYSVVSRGAKGTQPYFDYHQHQQHYYQPYHQSMGRPDSQPHRQTTPPPVHHQRTMPLSKKPRTDSSMPQSQERDVAPSKPPARVSVG